MDEFLDAAIAEARLGLAEGGIPAGDAGIDAVAVRYVQRGGAALRYRAGGDRGEPHVSRAGRVPARAGGGAGDRRPCRMPAAYGGIHRGASSAVERGYRRTVTRRNGSRPR